MGNNYFKVFNNVINFPITLIYGEQFMPEKVNLKIEKINDNKFKFYLISEFQDFIYFEDNDNPCNVEISCELEFRKAS
jgi:hypothetical protein